MSFEGNITGSGENIGGIVGCNSGGNILNCINKVTINAENAKNVGGIVGLNNNKNITNCANKANVKGKKNVGGIVGLAYKGTINECENKEEVEAIKNSVVDDNISLDDLQVFYNVAGKNSTGVGGIAGKIHGTTISCSHNDNSIICNFNGGGIVGIVAGGTIKYCYNKGTVTNNKNRDGFAVNRLGGICGAARDISVLGCYNIGEIDGYGNWRSAPLKSPVGGIIGFVADNDWWIGTEDYRIDTKYIDIEIKRLAADSFENKLSYCYNAGDVKGEYPNAAETTHYNGGIIGFIAYGKGSDPIGKRLKKVVDKIFTGKEVGSDKTTLTECFYKKSGATERGTNDLSKKDKAEGKSESDLKQILYNWASNLWVPAAEEPSIANKLIYNTISPLETDKGYDGYGVLWWELKNYAKLKVYICSAKIKIPDGQNVEMTINGKSVNISDRNLGIYTNGEEYHNWVMMIPKGETKYILGGKTRSSEKVTLPAFIASDDEIIKLIEIGGIYDNLIVHADSDSTINWSDIITTVERYNVRIWPDSPLIWKGKHSVYVKYNGKVNESKTEINFTKDNLANYNDGKFGSVFMDGDKLVEAKVLTEEPYRTTYYYETKGETRTETGSEYIKGKSACVIKIPIEKIEGRRGTKGIVFSKTNSTIQKANAKLRVGIYVSDNFSDRIGTRVLNDRLHVSVAFGNSEYKEVKRTIRNSYEYRKNNVDWLPDFTYQFSETKDIPEDVTVKLQWDANIVGVYVAIDYVDVDVTYYTK